LSSTCIFGFEGSPTELCTKREDTNRASTLGLIELAEAKEEEEEKQGSPLVQVNMPLMQQNDGGYLSFLLKIILPI